MLYRGFKDECPSGVLSEECFHYAYTSFFPGRDESYNGLKWEHLNDLLYLIALFKGNICSYTHYIYSLLDKKGTGFITFDVNFHYNSKINKQLRLHNQDFIRNLSILVHGSDDDKYNWMFDLYDLNGDGYITREEMEDVVFSVKCTIVESNCQFLIQFLPCLKINSTKAFKSLILGFLTSLTEFWRFIFRFSILLTLPPS